MYRFETNNFRHDSETLLGNNDFYEGSSFVGIMNENIYYNSENQISYFKIKAKGEKIDGKTFAKVSNFIPISKVLINGTEDFTSIFEKYQFKIDCDGNVYKFVENELIWVGYYDFEIKYV